MLENYYRELVCFLNAKLGNRQVAEDVVHDAYLRVLERSSDTPIEQPRALLYRTALNLVIVEGHGSHVTDFAGKDYIDYHLGSGPALLGHGHPAVVDAVTRQLPKGSTYYFLNEHVINLAERLVNSVPCGRDGQGQVQFTGSGTEATFFALRVARAYTGRTKYLKFEGGWHGMHDYALWGTVPQQASDYPRSLPDSQGIPP